MLADSRHLVEVAAAAAAVVDDPDQEDHKDDGSGNHGDDEQRVAHGESLDVLKDRGNVILLIEDILGLVELNTKITLQGLFLTFN